MGNTVGQGFYRFLHIRPSWVALQEQNCVIISSIFEIKLLEHALQSIFIVIVVILGVNWPLIHSKHDKIELVFYKKNM